MSIVRLDWSVNERRLISMYAETNSNVACFAELHREQLFLKQFKLKFWMAVSITCQKSPVRFLGGLAMLKHDSSFKSVYFSAFLRQKQHVLHKVCLIELQTSLSVKYLPTTCRVGFSTM